MYSANMLEYEISAPEVASKLKAGAAEELVLVDVREPWEYAVTRIEGSVLIPMGEIPARAFQELDPETHIVTICHHGVRSMNVAVWLRNQGFERVQSLQGGIDGWSATIDGKIPRY
jgi:rhodanese-related sulfurtransferase